jgi:hypothetical protein
MPTCIERPERIAMGIAGIAACLLLVPGTVAIVQPIAALDASVPDDVPAPNVQTDPAAAPVAGSRRSRCPDCGVITTIRRSRGAADSGAGRGYETTVRFRDGTTTVLNEAGPRSWQPGSRVMVIGRTATAEN